jgi:hypothetical protein
MTDHLELGHALITMVEPEPATVADYNRWYETDHFLSGVLTGPGAFAGRRWLAPRALKSVRFPATSPIAEPLGAGSFIAVYWIEAGQLDAHCAWGFPEAARLAGLGRMRSDRRHISTAYYDLVGVTARGERPVPAELALHHPYAALVMVWSEATASPSPEAHESWAAGFRAALTGRGSSVGQVVTFRPIELPEPLSTVPGAIIGGDPARDVLAHCCFVDVPLEQAWRDLSGTVRRAFDDAPIVPLLVAPFIPSVTGTDTYLDELW